MRWIVKGMNRLPQTLTITMTVVVRVIRSWGPWRKGEIFQGVFMLDFIIVVMVWEEVPSVVVWELLLSTSFQVFHNKVDGGMREDNTWELTSV